MLFRKPKPNPADVARYRASRKDALASVRLLLTSEGIRPPANRDEQAARIEAALRHIEEGGNVS